MPRPSPFYSRTSKLSLSQSWKDWAGYYAAKTYDTSHDSEYMALRHSAGLIDVSPLFKYDISGPDAAAFLSRVTVKNLDRLKPGRVTYLCWCDDDGKVVDDGTVSRLDENYFRVTAAEPSVGWFERLRRGYQVDIEDTTDKLGALSLQGPTSRDLLRELVDFDIDQLRFFAIRACKLSGIDVWLSRTGYTGDLGYEIWVETGSAEKLWDRLAKTGQSFGLLPVGLDAMDVTRIEAGFIMNGVDYYSAHHCLIEGRKSSPFELGLGWTIQLDREPFVGQAALRREKETGARKLMVGLEIDWESLEAIFESYGLPAELPSAAWRDGRPVYDTGKSWIGQATSGVWSPTLKKNLSLAQLDAEQAAIGNEVRFDLMAEYHRHLVPATVVKTPFFNPARKRE